jgi:bacterioferritin (cytochrome b1)
MPNAGQKSGQHQVLRRKKRPTFGRRGSPHVDPSDLAARSRSRCAAGADLQDMVGEDLLFVRTAIETYDDMVRYFETHDLTTARMLASILAIHEHHAEELTALMIGLTPPLQA